MDIITYIPEFSGSFTNYGAWFFLISSPLFFLMEATAIFSFGYSKFANRETKWAVPSRLGMFIIYAPAVLIYPAIHSYLGAEWTTWHTICATLFSLHFAKRCFETLFIHRYSGVMNIFSMVVICGLYSGVAFLLGLVAGQDVNAELLKTVDFGRWAIPGFLLWITGTLINLTHHYILANLRKPGETGYVLPTKGLFKFVACPHYLGEIIAWWGYALLFHHFAAFTVTIAMTAYLFGRGHNTVKWYRERMDAPENWKRIVPFIY